MGGKLQGSWMCARRSGLLVLLCSLTLLAMRPAAAQAPKDEAARGLVPAQIEDLQTVTSEINRLENENRQMQGQPERLAAQAAADETMLNQLRFLATDIAEAVTSTEAGFPDDTYFTTLKSNITAAADPRALSQILQGLSDYPWQLVERLNAFSREPLLFQDRTGLMPVVPELASASRDMDHAFSTYSRAVSLPNSLHELAFPRPDQSNRNTERPLDQVQQEALAFVENSLARNWKPAFDGLILVFKDMPPKAYIERLTKSVADVKAEKLRLEQRLAENQRLLAELRSRQLELQTKSQILGQDLAIWTLVVWFIAIILVIGAMLALTKMLVDKNLPPTINHGFLLEIVSLFVVTAAILILGLANKLGEQSLAALIGGVAGYLFGRTRRDEDKQNPVPPKPIP